MGERDLIEPRRGDRRFVRRGAKGAFITEVDVAWSLAGALCHHATEHVAPVEKGSGADPSLHAARFAPSIAGEGAANA